MRVLNIPVSATRADQWRSQLAPERQPFFLRAAQAQDYDSEPRADAVFSPQERDTYRTYNISADADRVVWLTRGAFDALPPTEQRRLLYLQVGYGRGTVPLGRQFQDVLPGLTPGRFVWNRDQLTPDVLTRVISTGQHPCQRDQVPSRVWRDAQAVVPGVRGLAGTFAATLAGNCFGAVMGAAGVTGVADEWTQREPFELFLGQRTRRGGQDNRPGTVLVWRSARGVEHAAVTLGGGWAFQKASQSWQSARVVLPVTAVIRVYRTVGHRLERHQLEQ